MLDYDGVLHKDHVYCTQGTIELLVEGELFEWSPALIEALAPYPNAQIVLSTSWARHLGHTRAKNYLPDALRERVIGSTCPETASTDFKAWWDQVYRYEQIKGYIDWAKPRAWIAIDDNDLGWATSDRDKLVRTDPERGLSDPTAIRRLEALLRHFNTKGAI